MSRARFAVLVAIAALLLARGDGLAKEAKPNDAASIDRVAGGRASPGRAHRGRFGTRPRVPKTIDQCVKYSKEEIGNEGLRLQLRNRCDFAVTCALSWELRCLAGGRATAQTSRLDLGSGVGDAALASGTGCGPAGWEISAIRWSCEEVVPPSRKAAGDSDL